MRAHVIRIGGCVCSERESCVRREKNEWFNISPSFAFGVYFIKDRERESRLAMVYWKNLRQRSELVVVVGDSIVRDNERRLGPRRKWQLRSKVTGHGESLTAIDERRDKNKNDRYKEDSPPREMWSRVARRIVSFPGVGLLKQKEEFVTYSIKDISAR